MRLALAPDLQNVPEALGGDESRARGAAGKHRVGGDRRAVTEVLHLPRADVLSREQGANAFGDRKRWVRRRGGRLVKERAIIRKPDQDEVRKGAADIHAQDIAAGAQDSVRFFRARRVPSGSTVPSFTITP